MHPAMLVVAAEDAWKSDKILGGPVRHIPGNKVARLKKKKNRKKSKHCKARG